MFDVAAISAALAASSNPQQVLADLDDEELADLRDETENPKLMALLDEELAKRQTRGKKGAMTGTIVWIVVIAMLIASIAAVAFR